MTIRFGSDPLRSPSRRRLSSLRALAREPLAGTRDHRVVGGVWGLPARSRRRQPPAPSFFAASRKVLTSAVGFLRPSSFSPWRLTQITGTFIFSSGATSDS